MLLETVPFVFDHLWTQDSPIFPLTVGGKTGPYIEQGGSRLRFDLFNSFHNFNDYYLLSVLEKHLSYSKTQSAAYETLGVLSTKLCEEGKHVLESSETSEKIRDLKHIRSTVDSR